MVKNNMGFSFIPLIILVFVIGLVSLFSLNFFQKKNENSVLQFQTKELNFNFYYSDSNNPITVQQWDEDQTLIKFEIETAGGYSLEIFDLMGRLREKRNYNFENPGQYRDFIDATSRNNEILIARLSFKNGKRIGVIKF
jgi:hypothetical protein